MSGYEIYTRQETVAATAVYELCGVRLFRTRTMAASEWMPFAFGRSAHDDRRYASDAEALADMARLRAGAKWEELGGWCSERRNQTSDL